MKIGVCAWILPGDEIESFKIASELGFDGVVINYGVHNQIHPLFAVERAQDFLDENPLLCDEGRQRYLEEAKKYNLEIPTLALNIFCERGMIGHYSMDYAKDVISNAITIASEMGIAKLQIPSFYDNLVRTEEDFLNTIEIFKYACRIGEEKDVLIGTENVLTVSQTLRLIKEVDSTHLTVLFDTQNPWRMASQDGVRIAEVVAPYVGELHAKDGVLDSSEKLQLGEGDVRFNESMAVFAGSGFDGWVQLESKYNYEGYEEVIKKDIEIVKGIFIK